MSKIFSFISIVLMLFASATYGASQNNDEIKILNESYNEICANPELAWKNEIIVKNLKSILGTKFKEYMSFVDESRKGVGELDEYQYFATWQDHVGGYQSKLFINFKNGEFYILWLNGRVWEEKILIYGNKRVPENILDSEIENLNLTWGHVASFKKVNHHIETHVHKKR